MSLNTCGQFNSERMAIHTYAYLRNYRCVFVCYSKTWDYLLPVCLEKLYSRTLSQALSGWKILKVWVLQRLYAKEPLSLIDVQQFSTGCEQSQMRAASQKRLCKLCTFLYKVLAVIQNQKQ